MMLFSLAETSRWRLSVESIVRTVGIVTAQASDEVSGAAAVRNQGGARKAWLAF